MPGKEARLLGAVSLFRVLTFQLSGVSDDTFLRPGRTEESGQRGMLHASPFFFSFFLPLLVERAGKRGIPSLCIARKYLRASGCLYGLTSSAALPYEPWWLCLTLLHAFTVVILSF